jgi:hypothetical protein
MPNHTAPTRNADHIEQFFAYEHLPPHLRTVSAPFHALATHIVRTVPRNPERTVALRKLLEAKDAAVRAALAVDNPPGLVSDADRLAADLDMARVPTPIDP